MKNAFRIFRRDLKRLLRSPAAMLVMVGVCILPSLYAWFNIAANIDPYANTSGIKIAVANNDQEATHDDLTINAGNQIIDNLKENDQLGWTFTSEKKAIEGVRSGKYYAAIVIPEDFSSSLLSILSGKVETPELGYYINEKANAIAPKITDSGASTIQTQINSTFSSIASESVSEILKDSIGKISGEVDSVHSSINDTLTKAEENLAQYEKLLSSFDSASDNTDKLVKKAKKAADSLNDAAASGSASLSDTDSVLQNTRDAAGDLSSALSKSISDGEQVLNDADNTVSAGLTQLGSKAEAINGKAGAALDAANRVVTLNGEILAQMQKLTDDLAEQIDSHLLGAAISDLNATIVELEQKNADDQELVNSLISSNQGIKDALSTTESTRQEIASLTADSINGLKDMRSALDQNVLPDLNKTLDTFSSLTGQLSGILNGVPATADQLESILTQLNKSMSDIRDTLDGTGDALSSVGDKLGNIRADLNALISSDTYQKLLSLEGLDKDTISEFMSSPVEITTETYYPVKNYGSSMTPFYTNLAIWVGGIVLIAILKMEVDRDESMRGYSSASFYFGRWLLYVTLAMIQGFIVCLGDIFLPGVQCVHPGAMLLTGVVCSFVYVNIIYALSLTFKHIGKALCVILVILQIPGSSGTYPVEMTPAFFQRVHPLLPFTYGVGAMREAIAGMYGTIFRNDLLILLLCYVPISLLIGLGLRPLLAGLNHLFDKKLAETEFMICEPHEISVSRSTQLTLLLKASLSQEDLQLSTAAKAQAFEKNYKRMIRYGFLAIIIIPLIFLILMFSLESKIVFLVLWIISIITISVFLIIVEFIHTKLEEQQELAGMSFDEMLENFRGKENEV